ncbi:MAG: DUF1289 domain-containing protein [Gammaproteobacteria bacterium]|nr:DUF1289 domain-containing protein [Gammaproteobacteria bacterium]MBU6509278.1 DUF1289 domain-containing protein [Gammaproteobacteria bacterium]MDE1984722.1 DUF1289 domain-containing protein [Gammaproteobacteria bacterium]MDE2109179.1 DUF1289 domain-containing protein [Gammaproteobacteria bacterium]MDE2459644.1 DUF1289 domain-containing protein [Gammaproteobacteria bacterium]
MTEAVKSPCVRTCCLDDQDICLGCGRTLDEIRRWSEMTESEKQDALKISEQRCAQRLARFSDFLHR